MTKWLKRYDLPNERGEGWAVIFLTSDGFLSAVSDYGSYGYRWTHHGYDDFRKFLLRPERDPDYLLSKLSRRDWWDGDGTCENVKRHIIEMRRRGGWSADRAREEWDLIAKHNDFYAREDFAQWWQETKIEDYELARCDFPPDARAFVTKTLPRLARLLATELAAESAKEVSTKCLRLTTRAHQRSRLMHRCARTSTAAPIAACHSIARVLTATSGSRRNRHKRTSRNSRPSVTCFVKPSRVR